MAKQTINVGTSANDGTGDTLRAAGGKINDNFTELYTDKAPLASPALTGTPTAPTAAPGTNTTQIATTAFVAAAGGSYTDEQARDAIGAALVAGRNVTITVNDAGDTITIGAGPDFIRLDADYTLTSTTSAQKIFDTTTNGRLTLTTGVYRFRAVLMVTGMSATSGNADFNLLGAGTATLAGQIASVVGREASANAAGGTLTGSMILGQNGIGNDNLTSATTATMQLMVDGMFKCTVAGTIIPSLALTTAAAAVMKAGSFMEVSRVADLGTNSTAAWS